MAVGGNRARISVTVSTAVVRWVGKYVCDNWHVSGQASEPTASGAVASPGRGRGVGAMYCELHNDGGGEQMSDGHVRIGSQDIQEMGRE